MLKQGPETSAHQMMAVGTHNWTGVFSEVSGRAAPGGGRKALHWQDRQMGSQSLLEAKVKVLLFLLGKFVPEWLVHVAVLGAQGGRSLPSSSLCVLTRAIIGLCGTLRRFSYPLVTSAAFLPLSRPSPEILRHLPRGSWISVQILIPLTAVNLLRAGDWKLRQRTKGKIILGYLKSRLNWLMYLHSLCCMNRCVSPVIGLFPAWENWFCTDLGRN